MQITAISDVHGNLITSKSFKGETLVIVGDIMPFDSHKVFFQEQWFKNVFIPYLEYLKFKNIIIVAGNHDFYFECTPSEEIRKLLPTNCYYLQNDTVTLQDVSFYGSPCILRCGNWAFSKTEKELNLIYSNSYNGCDVMLTHSPAFGFCDTVLQFNETENLGSKSLLNAITMSPPKYVISGHIHSGSHVPIHHKFENKITTFVGVSYLDDTMVIGYKPFKFKI